jgi:hypothetical protein
MNAPHLRLVAGLLVGCAGSADCQPPFARGDDGNCHVPDGSDSPGRDSADPDDSARDSVPPDSGADSDPPDSDGESAEPVEGPWCPEGMSPVPTDKPGFCIDTWEGALEGAVGDDDGGVVSAKGVEARYNLTFDDARAACEATPVLDGEGNVRGFKHLATDAEWEDAADGTVGAGGSRYPYGESAIEGACILPDENRNLLYSEAQPTGSAPACVSSFGVYDQIGNLWEWTDPGTTIDTATFLATQQAAGHSLSFGDDDRIYADDGDPSWLVWHDPDTGLQTPKADPDGALYLDLSDVPLPGDLHTEGYLVSGKGEAADPAEAWLAASIAEAETAPSGAEEGGVYYALFYDRARDGDPFTDKRGCAWYTGTATECIIRTYTYDHPASFRASIGFRCASEPIED